MRTLLHTRSALLCAFAALASATCGTQESVTPGPQAARLLVCTAADAPADTVHKVVSPDSAAELVIWGPRGAPRLTPSGCATSVARR